MPYFHSMADKSQPAGMLGFLRFYTECLKLAVRGTLGVIGDFGTIFAIGLAFIASVRPGWLSNTHTPWAS